MDKATYKRIDSLYRKAHSKALEHYENIEAQYALDSNYQPIQIALVTHWTPGLMLFANNLNHFHELWYVIRAENKTRQEAIDHLYRHCKLYGAMPESGFAEYAKHTPANLHTTTQHDLACMQKRTVFGLFEIPGRPGKVITLPNGTVFGISTKAYKGSESIDLDYVVRSIVLKHSGKYRQDGTEILDSYGKEKHYTKVKPVQEYIKLTDGGRSAAGYTGITGDCVVRAIANATSKPYQEVYDSLNALAKSERTGKRKKHKSNSRTGVYPATTRKYMISIGWRWHSTMGIGTGCTVHLKASELPQGRLVVVLSKHYTAVINGVIHDTYDPSRNGTRCVYGYYSQE